MSQAIQTFTPLPPSYPYQGNSQQQVSAALASSPSGMQGDSVAPAAIGVTAGGLLTAVTVTLAVKHFSRSGDKPKPAQAAPLTSNPFKRAEATQIESVPTSTEKTSLPQPAPNRQPTPPFEPALVSTKEAPHSPPAPQYITLPGFPGFIDPSDGVYREQGGPCGRCAYRTVRYAFGMEPITDRKFEERVPDALNLGTFATDIIDLARRDGLDAMEHFPAQFGGSGMDNIKAFIILLKPPSPRKPHYVAMVRSKIKDGFHLSDSADQGKREIYSGTATQAFLEYQKRHNFTAHSVVSFHEREHAHGVALQQPLLPLR